jgi:hypothetical protein
VRSDSLAATPVPMHFVSAQEQRLPRRSILLKAPAQAAQTAMKNAFVFLLVAAAGLPVAAANLDFTSAQGSGASQHKRTWRNLRFGR